MRNCPTCGRIWRRPTWDWANHATRCTLCSGFPSSLLARPARIRSRVRRRRDEKEGSGEWGKEVTPHSPLPTPHSPNVKMPELKLENSRVEDRYEVAERLSRGSFAEIL